MSKKYLGGFVIVAWFLAGLGLEAVQDQKKRTGKLTGEIQSSKKTPNGKNIILEVLAPGEEKARSYRVMYDPKVKGPMPKVLEVVSSAKVGDRVQLEWIDTGEGLAITAFEILKKAGGEEKKEKK
jgi:hypothetical protein